MNIRFILADDHIIFRQGLRMLIERQPDMKVVAEANNGREALDLANRLKPDVILMDVSMPDMNGIEAARRIVADVPSVKIIGLSMHSNRKFVLEMLKAGALGYLLKDCELEELLAAIRAVLEDRIYVSEGVGDLIIRDYMNMVGGRESSAFSVLSERESEVLQLLAEGKSTKEIAFALRVSVKTVEAFRHKISKKLGISSIAELTKYAIREGLTSLEH